MNNFWMNMLTKTQFNLTNLVMMAFYKIIFCSNAKGWELSSKRVMRCSINQIIN